MADFIARIKPRKSSTAGEIPLSSDLEVAELAANTADGKLFIKHTDGSIKEISGGGGLVDGAVRTNEPTVTTSALAQYASEDVTFEHTGRAGQFLKIEASCACWVVFYSSTAARTADAGRASDENPAQGVGVLMEVFFDQAETALITPSVLYFNDDPTEAAQIYAKVVNNEPTSQAVTVTATVVPIEGRALYEAEGTVRTIAPTITTSSIADGASADLTLKGVARSGQFISVETSAAARVVFYSNQAARTADAGRALGTEATPGTGVIMEVLTSGAQTLEMTPAVLYHNTEPGAAGEVYVKVENRSGAATSIGVTVTVVPIEGRGAYLSELGDLLDVNAAGVTDGQALVYDAATSKWIADTVSGFSGSYNDLTDVPADADTKRIQDQDDFGLHPNLTGLGNSMGSWSTNSASIPQADGEWQDYNGELRLDAYNDVGTSWRDYFETLLGAGSGSLFVSVDGAAPVETTFTDVATGSFNGDLYYRFQGANPMPSGAVLTVYQPPETLPLIPLAEGDLLRWDAAEQKFKPLNVTAVTGGTNRIQDLEDVDTEFTYQTWNIYSNVAWSNPAGRGGFWVHGEVRINRNDGDGNYDDTNYSFLIGETVTIAETDQSTSWDVVITGYESGTEYGGWYKLLFDPIYGNPPTGSYIFTASASGSALADGDLLQWNAANTAFEPLSITAVTGGTFGGGIPDISNAATVKGVIFSGQAATQAQADPYLDPTNTSHADWQAHYGDIEPYKPVGWESSMHLYVEGVGTTGTINTPVSFEHFDLGWSLKFFASNGCWSADNSDIDLEFKDALDQTVLAVKVRASGNYKNYLRYGASLSSLVYASTCGSYPRVDGTFTFTPGQVTFTDDRACAGNGSNMGWTFACDMASVTKIQLTYMHVQANWSGGLCSAQTRLEIV